MTIQEIIKQTETFSIDQKQQLAYYFFFSILNEDKKQDFMHLFQYGNDFNTSKKQKKKIWKSKGKIKLSSGFDILNSRENIYTDLLKQYD